MRLRSRGGTTTFVVENEQFEVPRAALMIHSPVWAAKLAKDPALDKVNLEHGTAASFRKFLGFLVAGFSSDEGGVVTADNVADLLPWGDLMGVDQIRVACESFLITCPEDVFSPQLALDLSSRYNMPMVYSRALEIAAQRAISLDVPESPAAASSVYSVQQIRDDLVEAHVTMGLMLRDSEIRRRHNLGDHTTLQEPSQRARLLWKSRKRFVKQEPPLTAHDWRKVETVFPHHSFRGPEWLAVPYEGQTSRTGSSIYGVQAARADAAKRQF